MNGRELGTGGTGNTAPRIETLENRIDALDEKRAIFVLRILLAGNLVGRDIVFRALELSNVVRFES